jgi:UDP:flavonoid glycosyltransferase YjiC (YdhE family)
MARFLFLCYHGKGHFNPCFNLARTLQKSHEVLFAGVQFFYKYITSQGFSYYPLKSVPFGLGLEGWVCEQQNKKPVYIYALKARWKDELYINREHELTKLLDAFEPDVILLDTHQTTDFVVLYPLLKTRKIRLALVHAMLTSVVRDDFPPVNSLVFPGDHAGIAHEIKSLQHKKQKRLYQQSLRYLGMSDDVIIQRRLRKNDIPSRYISAQQRFYGLVLKGLQEFIFLPREFDFKEAVVSPDQHYVGFQIDYERSEAGNETYTDVRMKILQKKTAGKKVIYCAFGTVPIDDAQTFLSFINKLIAALADLDVVLLLATSLDAGDVHDTNDAIYILNYVPQLDVLRYTDVFITHGGLNSIKEAIDQAVPMLVYPSESVMDPPGNSTRVVYHELGLRGDMKTDTVEDIHTKINQLLTAQKFKESVAKLKQVNRSYASDKAIALLSNLPPIE